MMVPIMMIILVASSILLFFEEIRSRIIGLRVVKLVTGVAERASPLAGLTPWIAAIGARYRRFYSSDSIEQLRSVAQLAGFNPHRILPLLIGAKTVSMFLFPAIAVIILQFSDVSARTRIVVLLIGVVMGVMIPRLLLKFLRSRYNSAVRRGTPEAIDLLVVCSEAGMGLESALERVAQEMRRSNIPMARVLDGLLDDLRVLPNRREAFTNLAARSSYIGLRRFGTMVNQSMQYGTPLGNVLRHVAEELRRERLTKLEERAHKLGAKLLIPMVIFLLPCMGIILGASSFLRLIDAFKGIQ